MWTYLEFLLVSWRRISSGASRQQIAFGSLRTTRDSRLASCDLRHVNGENGDSRLLSLQTFC